MPSTTSPSLLLRIRDWKDQDAWSQFLSIYSIIIKDYCFQRRLSQSDTDDITQEVMKTVSKAIQSFEYNPSIGRFRAWLGTITANTIKTHQMREARRRNGQNESSPESVDIPLTEQCVDPDSAWVEIYSERIVRVGCSQIRHQFSDKTWKCFELSWIENEPAASIAAQLQIPIHSVYVNKSRVLQKLETVIRHLADDLPLPNESESNDET